MSPVDREQHDKMLDRARKLLARATHKNTPEAEAETSMRMAQDLIAKYGFEEDELNLNDPTRDAGKIGDRTIVCEAPFSPEKVELFASIAKPMGVRCVQSWRWASGKTYRADRKDKKIRSVHAFGTKADLDRAELLYTMLLLHQATELRKAAKTESPEWVSWHGQTAWNRSWLVGYNHRIYQRMTEIEAAARKQDMTKSDGTKVSSALVLADKAALVDAAVAEQYPHLRQVKRGRLSGGGYASGDAAGRRADLGGTRISGDGRKALR